jgi:hypothetical protein
LIFEYIQRIKDENDTEYNKLNAALSLLKRDLRLREK